MKTESEPKSTPSPAPERPLATQHQSSGIAPRLQKLTAEIEDSRRSHEQHKRDLILAYEQQIQSTKSEIADKLQQFFEKRSSKIRLENDQASEKTRKEAEEEVRRELDEKFAFRLAEEKTRMCSELRARVEAEVRRDLSTQLSEWEQGLRARLEQEVEAEIRKDIEQQHAKSLELDSAKLGEELKAKTLAQIREQRMQDFQRGREARLKELQKQAAGRIEEFSAGLRHDLQDRLEKHISGLNQGAAERLEQEKQKITLECAREVGTDREELKNRDAVAAQIEDNIARSLHDRIRARLEPPIRDEIVQKIRAELEGRFREQLRHKVVEMKRKARPATEKSVQEVKDKCTAEHEAKLRTEVARHESEIREAVRGQFEQDRNAAESLIKAGYDDMLRRELAAIAEARADLEKQRELHMRNVRRLQIERKNYLGEFNDRDFELTKQDIELKGQLQNLTQIRQQQYHQSLILGQKKGKQRSFVGWGTTLASPVSRTMGAGTMSMMARGGETLGSEQIWRQNTVGNGGFAGDLSRILPNPDELVDKAIQEIGLEDIISKVVNRSQTFQPHSSVDSAKKSQGRDS